MNTACRMRWRGGLIGLFALMAICTVWGCGLRNGGGSVVPSASVEQYEQKVYLIGEMKNEDTADEGVTNQIDRVFINVVPYDGVSADAPIFIVADSVQALSDTVREGIRDTYGNSFPVVVINGGATEINTLLEILGLDGNYSLPVGMTYAELFAVDHEDDHTFTWSLYPPRDVFLDGVAVISEDTADARLQRVEVFREWLEKNGSRITAEMKTSREEAAKALAAAADNSAMLTSIADGFVKTNTYTVGKNIYQHSYWIYSCHSFDSADGVEYDWFYVRQEAELNASGDYHFYEWYAGNCRAAIDYYIGSYTMNNWMDGWTSQDSGVALIQSSPQNVSSTEKTKSSVEYDLSGTLGFTGKNLTGKVDGGVKIKNETEFDTKDCQIENQSMGSDYWHNAKWQYKFNEVSQTVYIGYADLSKPALLARGLFQPRNHWIWKISPKVRDSSSGQSFTSNFDVEEIRSYGGVIILPFIATSPSHRHAVVEPSFQAKVSLNYPPVLVVDHDMDFSAAAQYNSTTITVARDWTASSNQTWCKVEPASGTKDTARINITVDANTSGASRSATITFKTADGKGTDTMTLFQAQY